MATELKQRAGAGIRRRRSARGRPAEALNKLRALIDGGGYPPGVKLPAERSLAGSLGVGRPALREAIKALSILEVLETRRGDGTYVKSRASGGWPARLEAEPVHFGMLEVLEVRKMIEPRAAGLAAARATEDDLRTIEALRLALESHDEDWRKVAELDLELHAAILRAAQNPVLNHVHRSLAPLLRKSRQITARSTDMAGMHQYHRLIVEAIVKGQSEAAERAMAAHLQRVGLDLLSQTRR